MGADMLLGYCRRQDKLVEGADWSTAIAAKALGATATNSLGRGRFCVAVPHILIPTEVATGNKARKDDAELQNLAQFHLVTKGYYGLPVDVMPTEPFEAGLNALDSRGLAQYGGEDCEWILMVQIIKRHGAAVGILTVQDTSLEVALYSKTKRQVTWRRTASGAYLSAGLLMGIGEWLIPSSKRANAAHAAFQEVFKDMPDISTKTTN